MLSEEVPRQKTAFVRWMRSSRADRVSGCQCLSRNRPGFDSSILRHSEIYGAADEAVLNNECVTFSGKRKKGENYNKK